jgi:hypothetical protein
MTTAEDVPMCAAISQHGKPVTAYVLGRSVFAIARKGLDFICTQDFGHTAGHSACDGQGHILARWPRQPVERYHQPGDCKYHDHERVAERRGVLPL